MYKYNCIAIFISLILISCIKDVDFDQADNIAIETTHRASLIYFDLNQHNFLDDFNNEVLVLTDTTRTPVFVGPYTQDYLVQANFDFLISNSFNRNFNIQYTLLDSLNNVTRVFQPINVVANSVNMEFSEQIPEPEIQQVLPSDKTVITITLQNGTTLNPTTEAHLNFQSSVTFHYNLAP